MSGVPAWDIFHGGVPIPLLSATECDDIVHRLMSVSAAWREHRPMADQIHTFHTLGAASYLDQGAEYDAAAAAANPVLREAFGDLLARVAGALETPLGAPVQLSESLAVPGFHIFRGDRRAPPGLGYGGTIHLDSPHDRHRFPFAIEGTLSLTLPIRLPRCGGGMYHWADVPPEFMASRSDPQTMAPAVYDWFDTNKQFVAYDVGQIYLHDGCTVHQLANIGRTDDSEYRISLQGHGVFGNGAWQLFF